jgi:hypothetical protein
MKDSKELLIKLLIFTIFISTSFVLIIYSGRVYQNTIVENKLSEELVVSLSYLKTKVKMGEEVFVENYKSIDCLVLDFEGYDNYIYFENNEIKEIYVKDDFEFDLDDGETIMKVDNFKIETIEKNIKFTVEINGVNRKLIVRK